MVFEKEFFWKNIRLGTELQISGSFIYNSLSIFDQMETFYYEEECFEFLYNLSVGIERLMKICIILIENDVLINKQLYLFQSDLLEWELSATTGITVDGKLPQSWFEAK